MICYSLSMAKNVQNFGSQGQQRTTALSVKLAEIDLMHQEETGWNIRFCY